MNIIKRINPFSNFHRKYQANTTIIVEIILDATTIFFSITLGYLLFLSLNSNEPHLPHYLTTATVTSIIGIAVFERFGLYRRQVSLMNLIEIRKIIRAIFVLFISALLYSNFFDSHPFEFVVYSATIALALTLFQRMVIFKLQQLLHLQGVNMQRILIMGAGEEGRFLYQSLNRAPKLGYVVVGFLDEDLEQISIAKKWFSQNKKSDPFFRTDLSKLESIIHDNEIDEIFMCNYFLSEGKTDLKELSKICSEKGVQFSFIPFLRGLYSRQIHVKDIDGIPLISFGSIPLSHAELLSKRIFDILIAAISLLCLSPLFALIAFKISRDSEGPVFFKQLRVGKDGANFMMYKFRTMYVSAPQYSNSPQASTDERITRMGRFLRKTSLDELPQLFNVLIGQMSLVGPRPEMPFIVEEYNNLCKERLRVKPGITGVWQISGDRTKEIHENISYDIFYLENRSLLLDIIIIIRTVLFGIAAMRTY